MMPPKGYMMRRKAIATLSGGLDSTLSERHVWKTQGKNNIISNTAKPKYVLFKSSNFRGPTARAIVISMKRRCNQLNLLPRIILKHKGGSDSENHV